MKLWIYKVIKTCIHSQYTSISQKKKKNYINKIQKNYDNYEVDFVDYKQTN